MRARLLIAALAVGTFASAAYAGAPYEKSGITDWNQVPGPDAEPKFQVPRAKRLKLKNGLQLLVVENHKLPLVAMTLVVRGAGSAYDPSGKEGLASYTADLLDEGAGGLSAIQLAEALDSQGARLQTGTGTDEAQVAVSGIARTFDQTLALFAKVVTQPTFDAKEAERVKGDLVTALKLRPDRPQEVADVVLQGAVFGPNSPYGHPDSGTLKQFEGVSLDDAKAFYARAWRPENMTLVVAGDVDAAALKTKLDASLGTWKPTGKAGPATVKVQPAKQTARLLLVDRPGAQQSDVLLGLAGFKRTDPRYYRFEVMRTILGDGFTSRLNQRLREELGYTYGIKARMDWRRQNGLFFIASSIFTPKTPEALKEILRLVSQMSTEPVPAAELEKAKQNLVRAFPRRFETNAGIAGSFAQLALFGLPDNYYEGYVAAVSKVSAKDVQQIASSVTPTKDLDVVIVGDLKAIGPELDKLGLGASRQYDLSGVALP